MPFELYCCKANKFHEYFFMGDGKVSFLVWMFYALRLSVLSQFLFNGSSFAYVFLYFYIFRCFILTGTMELCRWCHGGISIKHSFVTLYIHITLYTFEWIQTVMISISIWGMLLLLFLCFNGIDGLNHSGLSCYTNSS